MGHVDSDPAPLSERGSAGAAAGIEIERKFLVTNPPADLARHPSERIAQGYLALDPEGAEVRLRRRGDQTLLTVKQGRGLARAEEEFAIDGPRFARLWAGTSGRRVEKTRFAVPAADGLTFEVDVYDGALAGLTTAEVEFASAEAAAAFQPPTWMRADVTGDARYANARLAVDGIPDRKAVGEHALLDGEPLGAGVVHVALAQIDAAADALQGAEAMDYGTAVHTARKAFKRTRALVRVAREGLGDAVLRRDNAALREAGERLSGARDALVVIETLDLLVTRFPEGLTPAVVGPLREQLVQEHAVIERAALSDEGAVAAVVGLLGRVRADVTAWDLGEEPAEALAAGFERIHRHGRRGLRAARDGLAGRHEGSPTEALHELRKRAKDLWYAAELLELASPKRMRVLAQRAHTLTAYIGEDHDLAVLEAKVSEHEDAFTDPAAAEAVRAAIDRRRGKLQRKAMRLADEIYGERPIRLTERIRELDAS